MTGFEKVMLVGRLRPIVESLGWVIVEETYKRDHVLVTLLKESPEKSSEASEASEE